MKNDLSRSLVCPIDFGYFDTDDDDQNWTIFITTIVSMSTNVITIVHVSHERNIVGIS